MDKNEDEKTGIKIIYQTPMPQEIRRIFGLQEDLKPNGLPKKIKMK